MKKNMFNAIKLAVIIPIILTACNMEFAKAKIITADAKITPNYFEQKELKVKENNEVKEDTAIEEPTPVNNDEVMAEANNIENNYVPTPEPQPQPEPVVEQSVSSTYYNNDYAYQVLYLINQIRKENGLGELTMDYTLMQIANIRAEEATRNWSHTRPDGSNWWTLHQQYGLHGKFGENLAYGQEDPAEVVQDWMDSEGHRVNILTPDFYTIGISVYYNDGVYYWSQEFAG
ncbi:MAG: CAP domain-containing protein [Bacilli bacterium]|nr:CAP domain-containing protein [Bacilli bacterium]